MSGYYFRAVNEDKTLSGWVGFVYVQDPSELFWAIDEFIDPYSVEIKPAARAGYCYRTEQVELDVGEDPEFLNSGHEFSGHEPLWDEGKWRRIEDIKSAKTPYDERNDD